MNLLRSLAQALSSGYILMFYSELMFWSRWQAHDLLPGYLLTWLMYSLLAFAFLWVVATFHVRKLPAIFLSGAVFGWLGEGVVVQTLYAAFPVQIAWTGLAWHALISVLAGWYGLQTALRRGTALGFAAGLGLFWGVWAISWWIETPDQITSLADFAGFAFGSTALLGLAYWVAGRAARQPFQPGKWLSILVGLLFLAYYLLITLPAAPFSILILPPLLALTLLTLRRNRQMESGSNAMQGLAEPGREPVPPGRYLSLVGMPLVACLLYGLAGISN